ncbi:MAG: hypothetical protein ACHQQQ_12530 [Bacteroidota bacterium]
MAPPVPVTVQNINQLNGSSNNEHQGGVTGVNEFSNAKGLLAGEDPTYKQHAGVYGESDQQGVIGHGTSDTATGVYGDCTGGGYGIRGETSTGVAVQGRSFGSGLAGKFIGDVEITGNLNMTSPTGDVLLGDIAEEFGSQDGEIIEPGTVVVLNKQGQLRPGDESYDKKVAGVVCGAGNYRPAIVLDNQRSQTNRLPVALTGKVCCKVDAKYSPIEVGDLLTTSPTPGHAMKACDPFKAFGAVIGKALHPLRDGQGLIPILIALQ